MAIPSELSRLVKNNCIWERALCDKDFKREIQVDDCDLKTAIKINNTVIERAIRHAELYYKVSRDHTAEQKLLKTSTGYALPNLHKETMALKKLEARLKGENKKRVRTIVRCNLEALQDCDFLKRSFLGRVLKSVRKSFFSFI